MTKEAIINELIIRRENLKKQCDEFRGSPSDELYEIIYENEIRISEINRIKDFIEGSW